MTDLIGETLDVLANFQDELINLFDDEGVNDEELNYFLNNLDKSIIVQNSWQMYLFLNCLGNIIKFHHEPISRLDYLQKIIEHLSKNITKLLDQSQLFYIALKSKLLLITLMKAQLLDINYFIKNLIHLYPKSDLIYYLTPEIEEYTQNNKNQLDFILQEFFTSSILAIKNNNNNEEEEEDHAEDAEIENPFKKLHMDTNEYIELREKGENTSIFCNEICEDNFEDFNILMEKNGMRINNRIDFQIYDSHDYPSLDKKMPSIFEYAAYKGSLEICKYLTLKEANIEERSWLYAIHGRNPDIIHLIEEHNIDCDFDKAFLYAIKCHNNNFADYIHTQYLNDSSLPPALIECISSYNFLYLKTLISKIENDGQIEKKSDLINSFIKYGYCSVIDNFIKSGQFDQNQLEELIELTINVNNSDIIRLLLDNSTSFKQKWVEKAIKKDHFDILKILVEKEPIQKLITTVFSFNIFSYNFSFNFFFIRII